jgi:hypothetical protein
MSEGDRSEQEVGWINGSQQIASKKIRNARVRSNLTQPNTNMLPVQWHGISCRKLVKPVEEDSIAVRLSTMKVEQLEGFIKCFGARVEVCLLSDPLPTIAVQTIKFKV